MCKPKSEAVGGRYRCSGHMREALDSSLNGFTAAVQSGDATAIKKGGDALFTKLADYAKTNEGLYAFNAVWRRMLTSGERRRSLDARTAGYFSDLARIAQTSALQSLHAKHVGKYEQKLNERTMKAAEQVDSLRSSASYEEVEAAHKSFLEAYRARREVLPFLETVGSNIHKFRLLGRPIGDVERLPEYDKLSPASKAIVQEYMEDVQKGYRGMIDKFKEVPEDREKAQKARERAQKALKLAMEGTVKVAGVRPRSTLSLSTQYAKAFREGNAHAVA